MKRMQALETFKIGANPIEALTAWCFSSLTNLKELDIKNLTSLGKKDNPSIEVSIPSIEVACNIDGYFVDEQISTDHLVCFSSAFSWGPYRLDDLGMVLTTAFPLP